MARLCERPGCSEPGAAAYGMVPEAAVFWIASIADAPYADPSVLCLRHADAMVVPRGWTLDDRREDTPRLFKPTGASTDTAAAPRRRTRRSRPKPPEQLQIDGTGEVQRPALDVPPAEVDGTTDDRGLDERNERADADADGHEPGEATPWQPDFDAHDDLDGLLEVSSPLLARAFRGTDRKRA